MNTNVNSSVSSARTISNEGWAAIAGAVGSLFVLARKLFSPKGGKTEHVSRGEFYAEMLAVRERINTTHLAVLDKLDVNHRELLGALERQSARVNALEAGLARVEERTCSKAKV